MAILDSDNECASKIQESTVVGMTRTFHAVGQGGFYTEMFSSSGYDYQPMVVYDCGGNSSKSMATYLDSFLPSDPKQHIEAVFISHLHDDHINGLQHLLNIADVKRIFLPSITPSRIFETLFYNALYSRTPDNADNIVFLINKAQEQRHKGTTTIQVSEEEAQANDPDSLPLYPEGKQQQIPGTIASGTHLFFGYRWVYIPYNLKTQNPNFKNVDDSVREELESIYHTSSVEELACKIRDFVKKHDVNSCKKIYESLYGAIHNNQSMTVFSGLLQKPVGRIFVHSNMLCENLTRKYSRNFCWFKNRENNDVNLIPTNFLYTGDFEAKANCNQLKSFYTNHKVWGTIFGVQVPHHGSQKNYNDALYAGRRFAIASAGRANRFNHPNISVITNIVQRGCIPFLVTEDKSTIIIQHFKFSLT